MATKSRVCRIALTSIALGGLAALAFLSAFRQQAPITPTAPPSCLPLPPNVAKIGDALAENEGITALAQYGEEHAPLKAQVEPGDTVHAFETAITGGHLVMRGNCFVGQAVAWIR